jgi:SnoaL-like domain
LVPVGTVNGGGANSMEMGRNPSEDWRWWPGDQGAMLSDGTSFPDLEPVYRGREGFTRFWNTFREAWESVLVEAERIEPMEDGRVVVLFRFRGRGRDGVEVTLEYGQLFTLEDGMVRRVVGFADSQALEAAGLEE